MITDKIRILVLCTGNSCRSQMAEGFFRHYLNELGHKAVAASVRSAGLETHGLNPQAIAVMAEVGIDISRHTSDNILKYINDEFSYLITVCDHAAQNCPRFPGEGKRLHWPFDDPAKVTGSDDDVLVEFRRVRDEIKKKVGDFLSVQT